MAGLTVVIITLNEKDNILRCLGSVKELASEIVVVDSGSSDGTAEICKDHGCRVFTHKFEGYGAQKQFGIEMASNDWILSIDADEMVSDTLRDEIRDLLKSDRLSGSGYRIPFVMQYMGRLLRHSAMGKEYHLRLFDRRKARFTHPAVHEGVEAEGPVGKLKGIVIHYSYRDISHHLDKINIYTSHAAEENIRNNKRFLKSWVPVKFPVTFFIYYILRRGFLDGYPGFMWSLLASFYVSLKIAKTIEKTP